MKKFIVIPMLSLSLIFMMFGCGNKANAETIPETAAAESDQTEEKTQPEAPEDTKTEEKAETAAEAEEETEATAETAKTSAVYDLNAETSHPSVTDFNQYMTWMKENTDENPEYLKMRWDRLQADNYYHPENTPRTREAFLRTPREHFIREYNLGNLYDHMALPIEDGQTIAGPHLVCRMTNNVNPSPDMKVLEIGTGSGYQSAVLAHMSNHVYTIEIKKNLFEITDKIYQSLEEKYPMYKNVTRINADGYYGLEEHAPFDRIVVTCGIDHIPPKLLQQLKPNGIMIIPIGPMTGEQVILKITKEVDEDGNVRLEQEDIYGGKVTQNFVPFTADDNSWHTKEK